MACKMDKKHAFGHIWGWCVIWINRQVNEDSFIIVYETLLGPKENDDWNGAMLNPGDDSPRLYCIKWKTDCQKKLTLVQN